MLEKEVGLRNCHTELSFDKPDPLIVARKYNDEYISLICALFAYGNANKIVEFLNSLNFSLLECSEETIRKELQNHYYRFQNTQDISSFFIAIKRLKQSFTPQNYLTTVKSALDNCPLPQVTVENAFDASLAHGPKRKLFPTKNKTIIEIETSRFMSYFYPNMTAQIMKDIIEKVKD